MYAGGVCTRVKSRLSFSCVCLLLCLSTKTTLCGTDIKRRSTSKALLTRDNKIRGEDCANSLGLYEIALMFEKGKGSSVDMDKAAEWMRKAVAFNSPITAAQKARDWLIARQLEVDPA